MGHSPQISGARAVKAFLKAGWQIASSAGSHVTLKKKDVVAILTVPQHQVLKKGTIAALIKASGLSVDEFKQLI